MVGIGRINLPVMLACVVATGGRGLGDDFSLGDDDTMEEVGHKMEEEEEEERRRDYILGDLDFDVVDCTFDRIGDRNGVCACLDLEERIAKTVEQVFYYLGSKDSATSKDIDTIINRASASIKGRYVNPARKVLDRVIVGDQFSFPDGWFAIDLGNHTMLRPSHYVMRNGGSRVDVITGWVLEAATWVKGKWWREGDWTIIDKHVNDTSFYDLIDDGSSPGFYNFTKMPMKWNNRIKQYEPAIHPQLQFTWSPTPIGEMPHHTLSFPLECKRSYRFFRLRQLTHARHTHHGGTSEVLNKMYIQGFELYGRLKVGVLQKTMPPFVPHERGQWVFGPSPDKSTWPDKYEPRFTSAARDKTERASVIDASLRSSRVPLECVDFVANAWRDLCGKEGNSEQEDSSDVDVEDIGGWVSEFVLSESDVARLKSLCQEAPNTLEMRRVLGFFWKKNSKVSELMEAIGSRRPGQVRHSRARTEPSEASDALLLSLAGQSSYYSQMKREERSALQNRIRRELEEFKKEEEKIIENWDQGKPEGDSLQLKQESDRLTRELEQNKLSRGLNLLEMRSRIKDLRDSQLLHRAWFQKREEAIAHCSHSFSVGDQPESSVMEAIDAGQRAFGGNLHKEELSSEFSELLGAAAVVYVHSARRAESRQDVDAGKRCWATAARLWEQQMKHLIAVWGREHTNVSKCLGNVKMAQQKSGMIFS
ncbi:hypothetical protein GUITHDRAFT_108222 [Guillardia theta CCMP2712]|uniref:Uncharacterized protein n=1 Tax=Guillardia theta (strain CCMP2712) TaxID=905079 RepID=L1JCF4_GUITC|nr:hypothetical protein GUITHDRAFT_108222 [Guillardia theta CCMP2712]EKX45769.1 hypothetical protein GUITHDRAFT_108222 [Guillardia theta CCMP2712]|eukprot:XP_005832749.1 hypothetical protein GUITHDRAFT_108222 [Guillardia theta CCMP2712]